MPFNTLLLNCLLHGTSFSEKGATVHIKPQTGETILFFGIDDNDRECSLRQTLGMQQGVICDLVVFYARQDSEKKVICLVELKGSDVKHAARQIKSVHQHFSKSLRQHVRWIDWRACIYMGGSAHKDMKKVRLELEKTFGKGNVSITRESDLGSFLRR